MKVLVTGGAGFIGAHVVDQLVAAGHDVRVLDIKESAHRKNVEFMRGNITSRKAIRASLKGIEAVYHLAAFANINLVKANPLTTIRYNIMGTAYLLEECRRSGVQRFILASSVYLYSKRGHLYTTAKLASEELCKDYQTLYSLPYTILRYGTAYGPGSRMDDVISIFVARLLRGEKLIIYGSGAQQRNFIYVEDLARGNVAALAPAAENQTYTLVDRQTVSILELAEMVPKVLGVRTDVEFRPSREDDYGGEVFELDKVKRELGWEPRVGLEEGIKRYADWYKEISKTGKSFTSLKSP